MNCTKLTILCLAGLMCELTALSSFASARDRWTAEKARGWGRDTPWLVGANYIPAAAINQLAMWQAESFDPGQIDKELAWAESLGFNSVRVFLHHLLWEQDHEGLLQRMDQFLGIADEHKIGVMFVLFDSVWDPHPKLGKQREPAKGVHNSGWVQSPGANDLSDPARHALLEAYVKGVVAWEMPSSWDPEALKAQAVVARTFGLVSRKSGWFDLYDDTRSQVYGGVRAETSSTTLSATCTPSRGAAASIGWKYPTLTVCGLNTSATLVM